MTTRYEAPGDLGCKPFAPQETRSGTARPNGRFEKPTHAIRLGLIRPTKAAVPRQVQIIMHNDLSEAMAPRIGQTVTATRTAKGYHACVTVRNRNAGAPARLSGEMK